MILRLLEVSKRFGGLRALSGVSMGLREGEILGLIGPNGAGKTTLFNVVHGVHAPDAGSVLFEGREITGLPPYAAAALGIARTHQIVKPLNGLSVRENVVAGACFGRERHSRRSAARIASGVLARVGLGDRADQPAYSLNVAQKKRLELARALASRPRLLLLDETLAGLNPVEVSSMIETIRSVREEGVSVLMIEHIMQAVMGMSDYVFVLDHGAMIAHGSPAEVARDRRVIEAYLGDPQAAEELTR